MRRTLYIAVGVLILGGACWTRCAERNHARAYFTQDGQIYRVELKGRRFPLVHDPLSLVLASTYEETFTLELPRIEGVIDGAEIHRNYLGRVVITNGRMTVDLYQLDEGTRRPLSWNDEYAVMPKAIGRTP